MKLKKTQRIFAFILLAGALVLAGSSCSKDKGNENIAVGTVSGMVTDLDALPIAGVTVKISDSDATATTGVDGTYSISNVTVESHAVSFKKAGFQSIGTTITASKFNADRAVVVNMTMKDASAKIMGTILDAKHANAPLAGVTVSAGPEATVVSGDDGKFLIENIGSDDYVVTFTLAPYKVITRNVVRADFVDGILTLDLAMGGEDILRGRTFDDLSRADKWYYSDYRGGRNGDAYPHWDWSTDYMCTMSFYGGWEEQNEGTTLQIRNASAEQSNPVDLDKFDSYVYGSKLITADNKILTLRVRTHNADATNPAYFGVQVVDLADPDLVVKKVGTNKTYGSGDYADFDFDLTDYIGKEVIVAVGIYRQKTGDYWKQLVLRRIAFSHVKTTDWNWVQGEEVVPGWHLTKEMVKSTMPQTKKVFSGISTLTGNRDNYKDAYVSWRLNAHVGFEWSFMPISKDPEVFAGEGYLIKTRGSTPINTTVPEAYLYSKFSIAAGSNQFTLKTRTFSSSNSTFFKVSAITNDGTVTHLSPSSNTASSASAAADGCWKFINNKGEVSAPNDYASFVYDLSQFNGSDVVITIGVYKGESNTDESKLVFYSINLN